MAVNCEDIVGGKGGVSMEDEGRNRLTGRCMQRRF